MIINRQAKQLPHGYQGSGECYLRLSPRFGRKFEGMKTDWNAEAVFIFRRVGLLRNKPTSFCLGKKVCVTHFINFKY